MSPQLSRGRAPGQGAKHPDAENVLIFEAPEVTFQGIKIFFYCNFSTKKTFANCNKASINKSSVQLITETVVH